MARVRNKDGGPQSKGKGVTRGSFAFKKHEAPVSGLATAPAVDWRNPINEIASQWGENSLPELNERMELATDGGYAGLELSLVRAQLMGERGDWSTGINKNTGARLHDLGFTDLPDRWANGMDPANAAHQGFTAARCAMALEYLDAAGGVDGAPSYRDYFALHDMPEDHLRAVLDQSSDGTEMRVNLAEAVTPGYKAKRDDFVEHGFDVDGADVVLLEHGLITGAQARDIRNELPRATPWVINGLVERGFTGRHLETYGIAACETYTPEELDSERIPARDVRSHVGATRSMPIRPSYETLADLHDAGHTDGSTVRKYLDITGAENKDEGSAYARVRYLAERATPEQVTHFTDALQRFRVVRDEDLPAIARVVAAGYETTGDVKAFWGQAPEGYRDPGFTHTVDTLDKAVKSGFSAEQARAYAGAGMPVSKIDHHTPGQDFWALGAENRKHPAWKLTEQQWREQYGE